MNITTDIIEDVIGHARLNLTVTAINGTEPLDHRGLTDQQAELCRANHGDVAELLVNARSLASVLLKGDAVNDRLIGSHFDYQGELLEAVALDGLDRDDLNRSAAHAIVSAALLRQEQTNQMLIAATALAMAARTDGVVDPMALYGPSED